MAQPTIPRLQAPIFVLGKKDDYVFVASTVEQAVGNTNRYLPNSMDSINRSSTDGAEQPRVLVLDELDFFDAAGQPLEPIVVAGELADLVPKDAREEIRERVRRTFQSFESLAQDATRGDPSYHEWLTFPDKPVDFESFTYGLSIFLADEDDASQTMQEVVEFAASKKKKGWLYQATHHGRR